MNDKLDKILGITSTCVLLPAYGDQYNSKEEVLKAWNEGKDFKIAGGGPYCSIRDLNTLLKNFDKIKIRYIGEVEI
jgi:hypothetical protein